MYTDGYWDRMADDYYNQQDGCEPEEELEETE